MRTLNVFSGVAVLFTTLAYGHLLHHFFAHSPESAFHSAAFWAAMGAAGSAGILSFVGACLLLKRKT
jgi:hypothetical protein